MECLKQDNRGFTLLKADKQIHVAFQLLKGDTTVEKFLHHMASVKHLISHSAICHFNFFMSDTFMQCYSLLCIQSLGRNVCFLLQKKWRGESTNTAKSGLGGVFL